MPVLIGKFINQKSGKRLGAKMCQELLTIPLGANAGLALRVPDHLSGNSDKISIKKVLHLIPPHAVIDTAQQAPVFPDIVHPEQYRFPIVRRQIQLPDRLDSAANGFGKSGITNQHRRGTR